MGVIKKDIEIFQNEYPDHFEKYQVDEQRMQFAWSGNPQKRPVIFVHGSPGSWKGWAHFLLNKKWQNDFHLIAVDRPGYGGSNAGVTEPTLSRQSKDILGVLKFNKSGLLPILVGHSYGGPVIAKAAIDYPEKIAGVIFVASSVDPSLEENAWYQELATWWPIRNIIPNDLRVCNEEILALKEELQVNLFKWSLIKAKIAIIHGESDNLVPVANMDFIKSKTNSDLIIESVRVPGLNHFVPWQRPDLIENALEKINFVINKH